MNTPMPGICVARRRPFLTTLLALQVICIVARLQAQTSIVRIALIPSAGQPSALIGHYLYCIGQPGLRIFDVSNPANAFDVGYRTAGSCDGIAFSGTYAYAMFPIPQALSERFQIFDASNPTNPVPLAHINFSFVDFCLAGEYVYLLSTDYSKLYDISDPMNPRFVSLAPAGMRGAVLEKYMYLSTASALKVWNIMTPTNPVPVGSVPMTNDYYARIQFSGNLLYVAGPRWQTVFDISNRTNPVPINLLQGTGRGLAISGNYCYLGGTNLDIYDVTDPTNAIHVTSAAVGDASSFLTVNGDAYWRDLQMIALGSVGHPPPPELRLFSTVTNTMVLSWPAPSPAFALQQTPDLAAPNWTSLADTPLVVNGRNQVLVLTPAEKMFYRLVTE